LDSKIRIISVRDMNKKGRNICRWIASASPHNDEQRKLRTPLKNFKRWAISEGFRFTIRYPLHANRYLLL
jgi:hypothetical protein